VPTPAALVGQMTATAAAVAMLQLALPECPAESVALTLKGSGPAVVGVPVIAPVPVFKLKPAGSVPLEIENDVKGGVPPVAPIEEL